MALWILRGLPVRGAVQHRCDALGLHPVGGLSGAVERLPPDLVDTDRGALLGGGALSRAVLPPCHTLVYRALRPVQRHRFFQKFEDVTVPRVAFGVRLLLCQSGLLQLIPEDQLLSRVESGHRFGPQLIHFCGGQIIVHDPCAPFIAAIYGPVSAVSSGIAEKIGAVGGTEEHAPAGVLHRSPAISGTVSVLGLAQELLGCFGFAPAESRHFAQLYDPDTPQVLPGLLAVEAGDAVVEPLLAHPAEEQALADALLAAEDADLVELASRAEAPGHRSNEHLPRLLLGLINKKYTWDIPLLIQMLIGTFIITLMEFIFGCIFNLLLNLNVWDYYDLPFNIMGQICLPYMFLWFLLSPVCIVVDDYIRYLFFNEEKPHYKLF